MDNLYAVHADMIGPVRAYCATIGTGTVYASSVKLYTVISFPTLIAPSPCNSSYSETFFDSIFYSNGEQNSKLPRVPLPSESAHCSAQPSSTPIRQNNTIRFSPRSSRSYATFDHFELPLILFLFFECE